MLNSMLSLLVLVAGWLLTVSTYKQCEAGRDHCDAQEDIRKSGPQHLGEQPTLINVINLQLGSKSIKL